MKPNLQLPKKVLILGSGALKIGEAGEFDYSGSQGAKALREEKIETVLINPNIATIQTSRELVDTTYFLPVTPEFVEKIIAKERPDGILLGFGGQTALNCGLSLAKNGVLKKYNVAVLGTPVSAIEKTEDRLLFRKTIESLGFSVPKSSVCTTMEQVEALKESIQYPVIVRSGFSLGGLGSGVARDAQELKQIAHKSFVQAPQILIEEYLEHWKEIEYEVVRDRYNNTVTVCNMENLDPMGIHTGESIVVAPSQTLTNEEYHRLREIAITVVQSLPIVGECNIQYALNPKTGDYRIIEVNARLSRSSALASKATGYPLAYIAAKLALGYGMWEIPNQVTGKTTAFFEPALDYIVVKIPRWDFLKFKDMNERLGSEMQSVGEIMAIGRTFEEAFQKGIRSLGIDYQGIISDELDKVHVKRRKPSHRYKSLQPTPSRPYNIAFNLFHGQTVAAIVSETGISTWFIERIAAIVDLYKKMLKESKRELARETLRLAKFSGFSDVQIGEIYDMNWQEVRKKRKGWGIVPRVCQIDTLAAEFPAKTNYLYFSYHRIADDAQPDRKKKPIGIIGGGPYQIGSSVEFDWCAVTCAVRAKQLGYSPIMINCNPETVSTDYDMSDSLYFEELTAERILDIVDREQCPLIVSMGGQLPNTLAEELTKEPVTLLGNSVQIIDQVEDREKFSALLDELHIEQPIWRRLNSKEEAVSFAQDIGYPVLIRPSYVLSGRAMFVAFTPRLLKEYLKQTNAIINSRYPLVMSKFLRGSKEVDFDAVAQKGTIVSWAISEHVEHAGVHSGDATLVLPSFSLSDVAKKQMLDISNHIALRLKISGPFNIQFLVNENEHGICDVLVIETNLRASRSFPFVSKVLGVNFISRATDILLGKTVTPTLIKKPPYVGVKAPHFSFSRLRQVDPVLRVEMASTGEVACFGDDLYEAYLKALLSTGIRLPRTAALLSLGGDEGKSRLLLAAKALVSMNLALYATQHTARFLRAHKIPCTFVHKVHERNKPNVLDLIYERKVDLVINLSDRGDVGLEDISKQVSDGYHIRRASIDANIPLFTKATAANLFVSAMVKYTVDDLKVISWNEYLKRNTRT